MNIAYIRVSTNKQDVDNQKLEIENFCVWTIKKNYRLGTDISSAILAFDFVPIMILFLNASHVENKTAPIIPYFKYDKIIDV